MLTGIIFGAGFLTLLLAFVVWRQGPKKRLPILMAVFCILLALIFLLNATFRIIPDVRLVRLAYGLGALLSPLLALWVFELGGRRLSAWKQDIMIFAALGLFMVALFSDLGVKSVTPLAHGGYKIQLGGWFLLYLAYTALMALLILRNLWQLQGEKTGIDRLRLRSISVGLILFGFSVFVFDFFLPFFFEVNDLLGLDSVLGFWLLGVLAYAIFKHRFLGIHLVARLAAYWAFIYLLTALFTGVFGGMVFWVSQEFWNRIPEWLFFTLVFLAIALYVVSFTPLLDRIKQTGERLFFKHYNPRRMAALIKGRLRSSWGDMEQMYEILTEELRRAVRAGSVSALIISRRKGRPYYSHVFNDRPSFAKIPVWRSGIYKRLKKDKKIIVRDELDLDDGAIMAEMRHYEANVIMPILQGDKIRGVVFLGSKHSSSGYSQEDLYFLALLKNRLASLAQERADRG